MPEPGLAMAANHKDDPPLLSRNRSMGCFLEDKESILVVFPCVTSVLLRGDRTEDLPREDRAKQRRLVTRAGVGCVLFHRVGIYLFSVLFSVAALCKHSVASVSFGCVVRSGEGGAGLEAKGYKSDSSSRPRSSRTVSPRCP